MREGLIFGLYLAYIFFANGPITGGAYNPRGGGGGDVHHNTIGILRYHTVVYLIVYRAMSFFLTGC